MSSVQLEESWLQHLKPEFDSDYMVNLRAFLKEQYDNGRTIYPKGNEYFAALNSTPLKDVKAVILGQDPYHGPGQAHGLCFSVREGVKPPPSLVNIFKEMHQDLGFERPDHGDLTKWANQGVLLLNSVLTVEKGQAASHQGKGWETFTDRVIETVNQHAEPTAFILWGSYAQKKGQAIDAERHLVIKAPHPSPLSAHRGFFGGKYFSRINAFLEAKGRDPIDWSLS